MTTKYLYLDDERPEAVRPFLRELKRWREGLEIEHHAPQPYHDQLPWLSRETFGGLILDLRLDQFPSWENAGGKAEYRATTLAQEIRTRATERKGMFEVPIVLWSTDERLQESYTRDDTGHDLFDLKCVKTDISNHPAKAEQIADQLASLVAGYEELAEIRSKKKGIGAQFHKFLGFETAPGFLDPRILGYFEGRENPIPLHEYARFILRELLSSPGPLIGEELLAARLGVDPQTSGDWHELKIRLAQANYTGPFRKGWPRWWASQLEAWWRSFTDSVPNLRAISASDRVSVLREHTGLRDLIAAQPTAEGYSTAYWTVCQATQKPLDPRDGLIIDRPNARPWHDKLYVSLEAELKRNRQAKGLKLDPLDSEQLPRLKARLHKKVPTR